MESRQSVPYGCETWSVTVTERNRLRVFEKRVMRRIFGPKRKEVAGGWRKLHNEELHNLCTSPDVVRMNKSRRAKRAEHAACSTHERDQKCIQNFGRKT
jgi:hypothetical protein